MNYLRFKENIYCLIFIMLPLLDAFSQQQNYNNTLWTVAWSPDGKYIATGGNIDALLLFDGKTFELIKTYPIKDVQLSRLKWHPSENILAVITQSNTFKAKLLHLDTEVWTEFEGLEGSFRALDWNYTGDLLAISEREDWMNVFTVEGKRVSRFKTDEKASAGIDWHPSKNIMVAVGSQIGIYNHIGDTLETFQPREKEAFLLCVEWHKSGEFFAVGDYGDLEKAENKMIQFWNKKGEKLHEIKGSKGEYRNIRWNPDGTQLATASDALRIWSKEGKLMAESPSSDDYLWGIDWSPDGKYIITSSTKGRIIIWNGNTELIAELIAELDNC